MSIHPVGHRVRTLREQRGWTRTRLANAAGIGYDALDYLEDGMTMFPRQSTILALASALGVDASYLLHGEGGEERG